MAEGFEGPVLSYEYKCQSCGHIWSVLSQQEIGLVCPSCKGVRIRVPKKRGTYKYKCDKCGNKWKKKNSNGGTGICPNCSSGQPVYPYKFKPDLLEAGAPRRMFGEFTCSKCGHEWKSGNSWEGRGQQCKDCMTMNRPRSLRPLRRPRYPLDGVQRPHMEELCEKCKELGYNCRNAPTLNDEESVISTSDSSVVSQGAPDDTTPVPSEHGSDIGNIDELAAEIEQLELTKN